ncbi:rhomboid family intramembrane serine protease [Aquimarina sp. RZ0]|uniref:rhomboid family intramembrane serine protease n=1 Tax=Aquimarina sp. RZ0 TaxID=2607730 RepID=UPI0011F10954|nr:rhomboid family intramembrane serine protease [Aquimarina sp. RZ0]KAA1246455.1 rhomboid family intramembrane serine protease [Aquimarina sp. RZ0]
MALIDDLKLKYKMITIIEKLIVINVVVFVLFYLLNTFAFLFKIPNNSLQDWFVFPKELSEFIVKPWTIITYAFLHSDIWHIASNMILMYFSGRYFVQYLTGKRVLTVYFLGAIFGALLYMLSYNLFPAFSEIGASSLLGASASVMAILIAIATYIPNMTIRLMFLGSIKFWWIAAFFVILDIIQIPVSNAGGHIAHLGGALFGYVYASQLKKGNDIGGWFEKIMDATVSMFTSRKKSPLKTVHKATKTKTASNKRTNLYKEKEKNPNQAQIDAILDKISKSGYESLTKQEKDFLFKAGKE